MKSEDSAVSEYKEIVGGLEELFFDLEKLKPIDLSGVYIILPVESKLKKKTILWGFSIAKRTNSKAFVATKKSKKIEEQIDKVSKTMNVEYEIVDSTAFDMDDIKQERTMVIMPRDVVPGMEDEKHSGPILVI